ncbi:MAG: selenocysteine-specific translation elongation factor [Planctomycetota bacterium]
MTTDLILGTAGHIDHGKSALIRALTGVDTDRLPEEKTRGITIDLGFTELNLGPYCVSIVDVPGHERFIRNMLAGATGMDLALLVVAADDSIKPQTREHLDILQLLHLQCGVIAITKCDLVDPEWAELVEEEVRELVLGSFLENAPIIRTSATTGMGLESLRNELETACKIAVESRWEHAGAAPFRMAIDRTFTVAGHGTVVTGSISAGTAGIGDELVIEPGGRSVRVRGLQTHNRAVTKVRRGQRAAMNLSGVHHDQIARGHELASPNHLRPTRRFTARIHAVDSLPRPLKNRTRVRLHVGTAELLATLVLLDTDQLNRSKQATGQFFLSGEAVTVWNQPFVIRAESPVQTIGGGHVLIPDGKRLPRHDAKTLERLADLSSSDPIVRAAAALFFAGLNNWHPADLPRTAGIEQADPVVAALRENGTLVEVSVSPTRTLRFHQESLVRLTERIATTLKKLHARYPRRIAIDRNQLQHGFSYLDEAVLDLALSRMQQAGRIRVLPTGIALRGHGPNLTRNEQKLLDQLIERYRLCGLEAPTVQEIQETMGTDRKEMPQLVSLAAAQGHLVKVTNEYYLHRDVDQTCRDKLVSSLAAGPGLTVSQIREILNTSRKYAVPYCEFLDRSGFTCRQGNLRVLAQPQQAE